MYDKTNLTCIFGFSVNEIIMIYAYTITAKLRRKQHCEETYVQIFNIEVVF